MPAEVWDWLFEQGPTLIVLIIGVWGMAVKGLAVPGYAYRREVERADRLEALLLRSLMTAERTATAAEAVAKASVTP